MKNDIGILILRLSIGSMMLFSHGWSKMMNYSNIAAKFPDPIGVGPQISLGLAIFSEFFCSIAIILGIKTRWSSFPLLVTMLVAVLIVHADDPWAKQEFGLLYAAAYLSLMFFGSGRISIDQLLEKKS